jgi:RNA polymerase sigma-70 factor (ECF subfamily)
MNGPPGGTVEEELVRRAARGDTDAFDSLARQRIDRLYAIAFRILRDHHDAEDAVQDALWTAWGDLRGLREPARFDAWLYRLLVRACYRAGRSRRRRSTIVTVLPVADEIAGGIPADSITERDALDRAFASLTVEHRAVVVLHHYVGLGLDEIASVIGIPHGTARSRLHYGLRRMRDELTATGSTASAVAESSR